MEEQNKISHESFNKKFKKVRDLHLKHKNLIKKDWQKELKEIKNSQQKKLINKKYRLLLKNEVNRYSLTWNALKRDELYRRGAKEFQISQLNKDFKNKKNTLSNFNKELEREKLAKRIANVKKKYSKPISTTYRRQRTLKVEDTNFVKMPINTPRIKNLKALGLILLGAFISTIALDVFIKPFGIYNAGLRGITQTIYYVLVYYFHSTPSWSSFLLFILFNIPLAIFGYFKVGKKFTIYTILMLIFQYLISMIFDYSHVEDYIKPFGKSPIEIRNIILLAHPIDDDMIYIYVLPLISGIVGAILYGLAIGFIYKAGASGGGSKFVVTWFAFKKNMSVGTVALIFSIFVVILGIGVNIVVIRGQNIISAYTSITLFATLAFSFVSNFVLDLIFSNSRKELILLLTSKKDAIVRFLNVKLLYDRAFSSESVKIGFDGIKKQKMTFLVSKSESTYLVKVLTQLDPKATITTMPVNRFYGKFYNQWFE